MRKARRQSASTEASGGLSGLAEPGRASHERAALGHARQAEIDPIDARTSMMLSRVRASGLKLTPQRMAIVRELAADPTHPTAQELFERLRPALPTMSFATVYNTLDALASAGLCAALSLAPGPSRFDANMEAHHHAVCDRCGLVRDVPAEAAATEPHDGYREIATAPGFEVRAVERIYRGLCASCAHAAEGAEAHGHEGRAWRAARA